MSIIRRFVIALAPLAVAAYCVFYWTLNHEQLANWYKRLNPHFYNAAVWKSELFTPFVKDAGNWWCLTALLSAFVIAALIWKSRTPAFPKFKTNRRHCLEYGIVIIGGISLSLAINWDTLYTSDEVFSALNFASLPSFQCVSNYPKPNNHLFFNALNGFLFFWSKDLVQTGRILSLACYSLTLCFTWQFLKKWVKETWLRSLVLLALAVQFPTLGFSFQARGYEIVLLCSCVSLFSFVDYFTQQIKTALPLHIVSNLIGIFTLPTYLYWWVGLIVAAIMLQIMERKINAQYIKATIIGIGGSMILYLPLLTFSGIAAVSENKYVTGEQVSHLQFLRNLDQHHYFDGLFAEWFCVDGNSIAVGIALLMAVVLLIFKFAQHPQNRALGVAYLSIALAFLVMVALMLRLPFYRNLIAHGYLSYMVMLLAFATLFRSKCIQYILGVLLLIFSIFTIKTNMFRIPNNLYYYDVLGEYNKNQAIKIELNINKPIYLDYESFYWWYVLKKRYPNHRLDILPNHPKPSASGIKSMPSIGVYQMLE